MRSPVTIVIPGWALPPARGLLFAGSVACETTVRPDALGLEAVGDAGGLGATSILCAPEVGPGGDSQRQPQRPERVGRQRDTARVERVDRACSAAVRARRRLPRASSSTEPATTSPAAFVLSASAPAA
jgi:hypothetical protein